MKFTKHCILLIWILTGGWAEAQNFSESMLPIVVIMTNGQQIPDEPKIDVEMGIIWNGPGVVNQVSDPWNHYNGMVGIEIRGSSSQWFFPKKQYGFETRDIAGNSLNVSLLGMPEENDWILYAPYSDKTLMRNVLTYKLSGEMGHYSSRTEFCELVINGEYLGVYVLMEKIKRDVNRVDVEAMDEDDLQGDSLSGGYIVKIDKLEGASTAGWYSSFPPYPGAWQTIYYQYHYPKESVLQPAQKIYVQQAIEDFETLMFSANYNDPEVGYASMLDVNSFVDFVLINELTKNVDGYRLSAFLFKDRNSNNPRWRAGPVWDFNIALGNADYYEGFNPEGWIITGQYSFDDYYTLPFWWEKLMEDPAFYQLLVLRWNIFRTSFLSDSSIVGFIDETATLLEEPQQRNYEKWPILGEYVWPNYFIGDSYEEEVDYLKEWLQDRFQWMDEALRLQPVITEINYTGDSGQNTGDWIEIYNPGEEAINLMGWQLTHGSDPCFTFNEPVVLEAGEFVVLCEDLALFSAVHPNVFNCYGNLLLPLDDQGETLELVADNNDIVDGLTYLDEAPWPHPVAGTGHTVELTYFLSNNALGENWHLSAEPGGTPGTVNSAQAVPEITINELMADNDSTIMDEYGEFDDWIELYNASADAVNVGGMYVTDDLSIPQKFQIPNSDPNATTISPGGFLLLWADNEPAQGPNHLGIRFSKDGEQAGVFMPDGNAHVDTISFAEQIQDVSFGRLSDGGTPWVYFTIPTPGYSNETISSSDVQILPELRLFPNPARNRITLEQPASTGGGEVFVLNLLGQVVIRINDPVFPLQINLSRLPIGVYNIVYASNTNKQIHRFIKQ